MVLNPAISSNYTPIKEYNAGVVLHGVIFDSAHLTNATCNQSAEEVRQIEQKNELEKKVASETLLKNINSIAQDKSYTIKDGGLEDYLHGIKSPVIEIPLDGNVIEGRVYWNMGFSPACRGAGNVISPSSIYTELKGDKAIPLGTANEYFAQLTRIAENFISFEESTVKLPFYFKGFGVEIPENHPLRSLFTKEKEERQDAINKYPYVESAWNDLANVHGEKGKEDRHTLSLMEGNDGKRKQFGIGYYSILSDRLTSTWLFDMNSANEISDCLRRDDVEGLILSGSFFLWNFDFNKFFK